MTRQSATTHGPVRSWTLWAAVGAGIAIVLTAIGTFVDFVGEDSADDSFSDFWPLAVFIVVAALLVFGLLVRTASPGNAGIRALVLGVLAALSIVVFWSGLPAVLAFAAVACALLADDGSSRWMPRTALILAALTVLSATVLAFTG
jgi:hypothetical protein